MALPVKLHELDPGATLLPVPCMPEGVARCSLHWKVSNSWSEGLDYRALDPYNKSASKFSLRCEWEMRNRKSMYWTLTLFTRTKNYPKASYKVRFCILSGMTLQVIKVIDYENRLFIFFWYRPDNHNRKCRKSCVCFPPSLPKRNAFPVTTTMYTNALSTVAEPEQDKYDCLSEISDIKQASSYAN